MNITLEITEKGTEHMEKLLEDRHCRGLTKQELFDLCILSSFTGNEPDYTSRENHMIGVELVNNNYQPRIHYLIHKGFLKWPEVDYLAEAVKIIEKRDTHLFEQMR